MNSRGILPRTALDFAAAHAQILVIVSCRGKKRVLQFMRQATNSRHAATRLHLPQPLFCSSNSRLSFGEGIGQLREFVAYRPSTRTSQFPAATSSAAFASRSTGRVTLAAATTAQGNGQHKFLHHLPAARTNEYRHFNST